MSNKNILVLGSANQDKIENIYFDKVYASNASIIKVNEYYKNINSLEINCVATLSSLLSDIPTRKNLNLIKPNRIIIRRGSLNKFDGIDFSFQSITFNKVQQLKFQKKFFNFATLSLLISEFFYGKYFIDKIRHFKNCIYHKRGFLGVSTGFFSILVALYENPNDRIYVSGITMENSIHFYKLTGKEDKIMTRHKVDYFMINFLKKNFKDRMYTNNKIFSKIANINLI